MKLVIKRSEWLHGEGEIPSYLLRPADGRKCCLGILALACGIKPELIDGIKDPSQVRGSVPPHFEWATTISVDSADAMRINDATVGKHVPLGNGGGTVQMMESEEMREHLIAELFKKHDIDVVFED